MKSGKLLILLIDDAPDDVFFVQEATRRGGAGHTVYPVGGAVEAISYLKGEGQYADRHRFPLPNVILSDVRMPGMDGFDFLRWVREHPEYQIIPVVIYSSSSLESDVRKAYSLGANSYIVKPKDLDGLVDVLHATYEYWSRCECPPMHGIG